MSFPFTRTCRATQSIQSPLSGFQAGSERIYSRSGCTCGMRSDCSAVITSRVTLDFPDAATSAFFWVKVASDNMDGKFKQYMVTSAGKQFICPSGIDDVWSVTYNGNETTVSNYRYANACGWFYASVPDNYGFTKKANYGGRKLSRNRTPSRTAVLEDGKCNVENKGALGFEVNNSLSGSNMPLPSNKAGASSRHNGYTNLLFADGHCDRKKLLMMTLDEYSYTCGWKAIWSY